MLLSISSHFWWTLGLFPIPTSGVMGHGQFCVCWCNVGALWSLQYCVNALINFIPFLVDPTAISHSNQWCDGSSDRSLMMDQLSYSHSVQCSKTGVSKNMVCAILSVDDAYKTVSIHGAVDSQTDPSFVDPLSHFSFLPVLQTGVPTTMLCTVLSVKWYI